MKAAGPLGVRDVLHGDKPIKKLFTKEQRQFYAEHAPEGLDINDLSILGPINVFKLKWKPVDFPRKVVGELWNYPDGSRILELSTKCLPADAFQAAAEGRAFLGSKGIDTGGEQTTKTRTALEFFATELKSLESIGVARPSAASTASAASSVLSSAKRSPVRSTPTGRPSTKPAGTHADGKPSRFAGITHRISSSVAAGFARSQPCANGSWVQVGVSTRSVSANHIAHSRMSD